MVERIDGDEFARSFALQPDRYAWFLGAGASAAANIPTAYDLILDFKATLFCGAMQVLRREVDASDPLWRDRITSYFDDAHGLPAAGSAEEYGAAFEAVFPDAADRQRYLEGLLTQAGASYAHRVLASLVSSGRTPCIFTTNFDPLVERSTVITDSLLASVQRHLTVADLDTADRAERAVADNAWPLLVKVHGDYKSTYLKNTTEELQTQDERLRRVLETTCDRFGLVACGYSGRDNSIMDVLQAVAENGGFPAGLYWCTRPGKMPFGRVTDLLQAAADTGTKAVFVEIETFDELAADLHRHVQFEPLLTEHIESARPAAIVVDVVLPEKAAAAFPAIRCSALPLLSLPQTARVVRLNHSVTTPQLRDAVKTAGVRASAVAKGRTVLAFGRDDGIAKALAEDGAVLAGEQALDLSDSVSMGLIYDAFVRALCARRPLVPHLSRRGHDIVIRRPRPTDRHRKEDAGALRPLSAAYGTALTGVVPGTGFDFAEAVAIRVESHDGRWWCVFDPWTWIALPHHSDDGSIDHAAVDRANDWRRERWATKYNPAWNRIIDAWSSVLAPQADTTVSTYGIPLGEGVDATFVVRGVTAWSRSVGRFASRKT